MFKPSYDRVLILPDKPIERTPGGIVLTKETLERTAITEGTVVAVGPGLIRPDGSTAPMCVKPGDYVKFDPLRTLKFEYKGVEYAITREIEIIGHIPPEDGQPTGVPAPTTAQPTTAQPTPAQPTPAQPTTASIITP